LFDLRINTAETPGLAAAAGTAAMARWVLARRAYLLGDLQVVQSKASSTSRSLALQPRAARHSSVLVITGV